MIKIISSTEQTPIIAYTDNEVISVFNTYIYIHANAGNTFVICNIDAVKINNILYSAIQVASLMQETFLKLGYDTSTKIIDNQNVHLIISWAENIEVEIKNSYKVEFTAIPSNCYRWLTSRRNCNKWNGSIYVYTV